MVYKPLKVLRAAGQRFRFHKLPGSISRVTHLRTYAPRNKDTRSRSLFMIIDSGPTNIPGVYTRRKHGIAANRELGARGHPVTAPNNNFDEERNLNFIFPTLSTRCATSAHGSLRYCWLHRKQSHAIDHSINSIRNTPSPLNFLVRFSRPSRKLVTSDQF